MRFPVGNLRWVNDGYKKSKAKEKTTHLFFRGKKTKTYRRKKM